VRARRLRRGANHAEGGGGDDTFFIRRDHPDGGGRARRGDATLATLIGLGVDLDPQPRESLADAIADYGGVLADAGGEDQRIQPA
jgi:hypothetical protein